MSRPSSEDVRADRRIQAKTIAVGSDDAGFRLKEEVKKYLEAEGHAVKDYGCDSPEPVDYPDVALLVANAVARGDHDRAILVCGTGIGMAITANKVPGVYATVAHDPYSAAKARTSNNTQVLALGARVVAPELATTLVGIWLQAEFAGGASARKVGKIAQAEQALDRKPRTARSK
ncbi:MAG TPA: ribose 5-phosphate isomerase B [Candidatus Dormibacteraeota bacterium]|nr:ribose 5-phosphate isomerase B [Candidatus Dormibacteraeota bacterium]